MTTKGRYYMTPGGYKLDIDCHGNVQLTEPQSPNSYSSAGKAIVLDLCPEDINELAAMFGEAARDLQPETRAVA